MNRDDDFVEEPPPDGGTNTLEIAARHLQVLLAAIGGSDSKMMFLTALNVAGSAHWSGLR